MNITLITVVALLLVSGCGSSDDSSRSGAPGGSAGSGTAGSSGNGGTPSGTGGTNSSTGAGGMSGSGGGSGSGATGGGGSGGASGRGTGGAPVADAALDGRNAVDSGASDGSRSDAASVGRDGAIGTDAGAADASTASCDTRRNGAVIDFRICNQSLRMFVTNGTFITEAQRLQGNGQTRIACFPMLQDGRDCDPMWTWHADPSLPYWTDFELEVYFACPADVEKDKVDWVQQIGQYCGQITSVTAVRDNR